MTWYAHFASLCIHYALALKTALFWGALTIVLSGLAYALVATSLKLFRGRRAVKRLSVRATSTGVNIIDDEERLAAFTHGLFRPRIYVTKALVKSLTREELRGVLSHEEHHRRMRDPLRLVLLGFISDAFYYLPLASWLVKKATVQKEFAADRAAIGHAVDPLSYAGALVKVARFTVSPAYSTGAGINGQSAMEERVLKLLGKTPVRPRLPLAAIILTCVVVVSLTFAIASPAISDTASSCESGQCTVSSDSGMPIMDSDCAKHCKM